MHLNDPNTHNTNFAWRPQLFRFSSYLIIYLIGKVNHSEHYEMWREGRAMCKAYSEYNSLLLKGTEFYDFPRPLLSTHSLAFRSLPFLIPQKHVWHISNISQADREENLCFVTCDWYGPITYTSIRWFIKSQMHRVKDISHLLWKNTVEEWWNLIRRHTVHVQIMHACGSFSCLLSNCYVSNKTF